MTEPAMDHTPQPGSLEALLNDAADLKDAIELLNDQLTPLKAALEEVSLTVLGRMEHEGLDRTRTSRMTASVGGRNYARITAEGRREFIEWLREDVDRAGPLLGNNLSGEAMAEYQTLYEEYPPGTNVFHKPTLNLRRRN
jgi:DNA-binding PadR family transcriptional regulator